MSAPLYTIGHSTRSLEELIDLLEANRIASLADIRRYPASRRHPHFSGESLAASLPGRGIEYVHLESLGGRRKADPQSRNTGWRNESFRGYADYMGTAEFAAAVDHLLQMPEPVAILCAEAVPWRCHRNLVSDELVHRGMEVFHIIGAGSVQRHELNPMAVVRDGRLLYPAAGGANQMELPVR